MAIRIVRSATVAGRESLCRSCRYASIQTGYSAKEEEIRCCFLREARLVSFPVKGCTDYLSKPVSRRDLLRTVARHIRNDAGQLESSTRPPSPAAVPPVTIRSDLRGEPEVQQFLGSFISHLPQAVGRLSVLIRKENLAELREVLHQLKGTGGLYGFPQITDAAEAAQNRVDAEQSLADIASEVKALVEIIRRVEGYDPSREIPNSTAKNGTDGRQGKAP